jgi:hypothetical protein
MKVKRKYVLLYMPNHPLSYRRGYVAEHQRVLYDKIGPGRHQCNWCNRDVFWPGERRDGEVKLIADHVNEDTSDNDPGNLVPSCTKCNIQRNDPHIVRDHELYITGRDGIKHRAERRFCKQCGSGFLNRIAYSRIGRGELYCSMKCVGASKRGQPRKRTPT